MTFGEWLRMWQARLGGENTLSDLRLLLEHLTGLSPAAQRLREDDVPDAYLLARLDALAARLAQGEPLAYVLGHQPFYDLDLRVTPATLIPRADTEILVEAALARLPARQPVRVIDLGTGSGAVALAIAKHRPLAQVLAVDSSRQAIDVAKENAEAHGIANCAFVQAFWLDALAAHCADMIVSNPPYIAEGDAHLPALRHEPLSALVSKNNGLADIDHIVRAAPRVLKAGGWLLFEHGYDQRDALPALLGADWQETAFLKDYGGNWRVCACRRH